MDKKASKEGSESLFLLHTGAPNPYVTYGMPFTLFTLLWAVIGCGSPPLAPGPGPRQMFAVTAAKARSWWCSSAYRPPCCF